MKRNKKGLILSILGILGLIVITSGVTYAFFNYVKQGTIENTVTTGTITFLYTEVDQVGAGISIEDALPTSDEVGKVQTGAGKEFNFKVTSRLSRDIDIPYTVTARKKDTSTLDESIVRMYLTEVAGSVEKELLLDNYSNLEDYENTPEEKIEKVIYTGLVPTGSTNYEKEFKLRMWVDSSIDFSPEKDENGQDVYPYNNKSFTVTVNVYANAKVVTDAEIDMANTTAINTINVNEGIAEEVSDSEEYDYLANVENEVSSVSLDIETTNPEATVEVTKIEQTTAYNTKTTVKRLSTKVTLSLEEGDNLFNIKVVSANKQVEKDYVLNIYRTLSCAYKSGDVVGTFDYTGSSEEFIVPCSGTYKLEVYGAQGGSYNSAVGGKGGYSYGNISLTKSAILYVAIGGQGNPASTYGSINYGASSYPSYLVLGGYNGGGNAYFQTNHNQGGSGGGGATHIAMGDINRGELKNYVDYKSEILIVAGGGGGTAGGFYNIHANSNGGDGGGLIGGTGSDLIMSGNTGYGCSGGTQSSGNAFGQGDTQSDPNLYNVRYAFSGGGGGGYYGGYANAGNSLGITAGGGGGGGGSGYIGGVTEGSMSNGVREGNGYAQITLVSLN